MSEATQPLLAEGGVLDAGAPDGAPDAAAAAEAGRPRLSVAALRAVSPEQAIKLLEAHGVETLGSMKVKDAAFKQALGTDGDDVLTSAAAAPPGSGFDWRGFWGARMPKSRGDAAGKQKQVWTSDVQVVARAVAVEGAAAPGEGGLVHLVNARFQVTGDPSIFTIPAVEAVITYKWNAFARRALKAQLAFYFAWLLSFTLFTWLFQDEDLTLSLVELLETSRGATTVALQVAALAAMLPFLYQEVRLVLAYGVWRWAGVWNILDSAAYALQFAITYVHLERSYVKSPSFSVVLAVQCLLLFAKIQYYSRVLQSANTSFVDTLRTVLADEGVCYFLIFLILSFYSFAAAFHILFRLDQEADEFATFLHTTGTIFAFATGGPNFEVLWKSSVPLAASCLCFVYNFTIAIVLLNLLIAVLSDSYGRIVERMEGHFRAAQASMIDELELTLPSWLYANVMAATPAVLCSPAAVLFLQRADDEGGDGGGGGGPEAALDELRSKVEGLEAQLSDMQAALLARLDALALPSPKGKGR